MGSEAMREFFKCEYDVVCSLGSDCMPATYLKAACLRNASYPFDWTLQMSFDVKARLVLSGFSGFLEPANVREYPKLPSNTNHVSHVDDATGTIFLHDFDPGVEAGEMLATVRARYARRIQRLLDAVRGGRRVLLVNFEREQNDTPTDHFTAFLADVAKVYPDSHVSLLALKNRPGVYEEEQVAPNLMIVRGGFYPPGVEFPGDRDVARRVFSRIRPAGALRRYNRGMRMRRFLIRLVSHLAIFGGRRRLRERLQKRFGVPAAL